MRGLRVRDLSDDGHRWSLEPVLRSKCDPVFIQSVKDYVMKRWKVFHSKIATNRQSLLRAKVLGNVHTINVQLLALPGTRYS